MKDQIARTEHGEFIKLIDVPNGDINEFLNSCKSFMIKRGMYWLYEEYKMHDDEDFPIIPLVKLDEYFKVILEDGNRMSKDARVIDIKDTPQELIQVGDLVKTSIGIFKITFLEDSVIASHGIAIDFDDITKILTPNSNGGYDLQYEVKHND